METFSASVALCAGNSPVNSPHKGQWRGALMFSLICARINGWINNREAGDLGRHRTLYYAIVMRCAVVHCKIDIRASFNGFSTSYKRPRNALSLITTDQFTCLLNIHGGGDGKLITFSDSFWPCIALIIIGCIDACIITCVFLFVSPLYCVLLNTTFTGTKVVPCFKIWMQ